MSREYTHGPRIIPLWYICLILDHKDSWPFNFHDGGRYHVETSPLICSANRWTGFYMITASVMKELKHSLFFQFQEASESTLRSLIARVSNKERTGFGNPDKIS